MTHLSLFTGIGGIDLAAEMAGFRTVGQVEIDDYCNRVLEYHWPNVPRWRDVKDVTAESFERRTGIKPGTLAVLSGGFPCQPVSCAGKRKGDADERWLWDEMLRVICEIRPRWVVAENVRGLLSAQAISDGRKLFGRILRDLAQNGYRVGWLCYGAGDVGAPHKRERVFIVAYSQELRGRGRADKQCPVRRELVQGEQTGDQVGDKAKRCGSGCGEDVADTEGRQSRQQETRDGRGGVCGRSKEVGNPGSDTERTAQPGLGRVLNEFPCGVDGTKWPAGPGPQHPWEPPRIATGVKDRVAKLKALGNAVVPAQAYPIFKAIRETEEAIS